MAIGKSLETWRKDFTNSKFAWCIEDAEKLFMSSLDVQSFNPMEDLGYDGKSSGYLLEAMSWLHKQKGIPVPK